MSDAGILAALDGWLGDAEAPPAHLIKPNIAHVADMAPPANPETFAVLEVTKPVTTETAPLVLADADAQLCEARAQAFTAKGVPSDEADRLACSLMRRDRQLDDRRSCAECMSFHAGRCLQRITPIGETTLHTLHRCKGFKLSEVTHD